MRATVRTRFRIIHEDKTTVDESKYQRDGMKRKKEHIDHRTPGSTTFPFSSFPIMDSDKPIGELSRGDELLDNILNNP